MTKILIALLLTVSFVSARGAEKPTGIWSSVDQLISEQKIQAAQTKTAEILRKARAAKDTATWTEGLIRYVTAEVALHGYETAVRYLKNEKWPEGVESHILLQLYYAQLLMNYHGAYAWEIGQREKTLSTGKADLKSWTIQQIDHEIRNAFEEVMKFEASLSKPQPEFFKPFILKNNYPAKVRPTLGDAVVYMAVAHLANTSFWTPEQTNEIYKLKIGHLVKKGAAIPIADAKNHPVLILASLLLDHELRHREAGRDEAALEAHYELFRRLHESFKQDDDRRELKKLLIALQKTSVNREWWGAGQALLAEFYREEDGPESLIDAHEAAVSGAGHRPGSIASKLCLALAKTLEQPAFTVTSMVVDGAGRRSLLLEHSNLNELFFRAYPFDVKAWLKKGRGNQYQPQYEDLKTILKSDTPAAEWKTALTDPKDFRTHRTFVQPKVDKTGGYVVVSSARKDFESDKNQVSYTIFMISDILIEMISPPSELPEVRVRSGADGAPVAGATVTVFEVDWNKPPAPIDTRTTDREGSVKFSENKKLHTGKQYFVTAEYKNHFAVDTNGMWFYPSENPNRSRGSLIYTDRSIYRPGQKIFWKIAAYEGKPADGDLKSQADGNYEVILRDPNYQEVVKKIVKTNAYGTASGEFIIPAGRPLGSWQISSASKDSARAADQNIAGWAQVSVEEYKRPTFEVLFKVPENSFRINHPATLSGEARYYFGQPVSAGKVLWTVKRTPVYPWWWFYWGRGGGDTRAQIVASGSSAVKEDGTFAVQFTPEADERRKSDDISYNFQIEADVTDDGGETRSANQSIRVGFVAVEANLSSAVSFFAVSSPAEFQVHLHTLNGKGLKSKGTFEIKRLAGPEKTLLPADLPLREDGAKSPHATADDYKRARWETEWSWEQVTHGWKEEAKVARGELAHDEKGEASITLKAGFKEPGVYRLAYDTKDEFGTPYHVSRDFIVASTKSAITLPLLALAQTSSVKVGEKARLLVQSGFVGQPVLVDFYRGGRRYKRIQLTSGKDPAMVEYSVTVADRGGFAVVVTAIRDYQSLKAEIPVMVPWDDKRLNIEMTTFRDRLRPGSKETFRMKITGPDQKAASAEILSYMYDRSLDYFAPHSPQDPISLYPYKANQPQTRLTLGSASSNILFSNWPGPPSSPALIPDELKFLDGYGIGGPGGRAYGAFAGSVREEMDGAVASREKQVPASAPVESKLSNLKKEVSKDKANKADQESTGNAVDSLDRKDSGAPAPEAPRTNFSETAFWQPHLLTGADGSVSFEFQVPDSVTSWKLWVHAISKDLKSGSLSKETKSVKELMVRPYVPRFLREGDAAEIKVTVNNASDKPMSGALTFDIQDPETEKSLNEDFGLALAAAKKSFQAPAQGSVTLSFMVKAPKRVGVYAFKVMGRTKDFSDGERRPFPVLPSRVHLAQSRFTVLKEGTKKSLEFRDLAASKDPTRINEKMVVTVDAQLFYGVLQSLPYLVNYPYECTEQTLNRFISTAILSSMFSKYPAVEKMAEEFGSRKTQLEQFDEPDANRRMTLEESPWLLESKGGVAKEDDLSNVLKKQSREAVRRASLEKLKKLQLNSGAFPWFQGGPPDPYMTLYIMYGFSKALEFKAEVPKDMIVKGWSYLHSYFKDDVKKMMREKCCWEYVTFLNYVISNYPDLSWTGGVFTLSDRAEMLEYSFRYWKYHSPYLKGYLALTLKRANRVQDAGLVWDSVMDSAKTDETEGTHWAREDRSWLWYNDDIESHAMALRTLMELEPKDKRSEGLVQWLFLNKKLNHWKSTRATAEVIYSLLHYLDETAGLGKRETVIVDIANQKTEFNFEPEKYTGKKNQIVIEGAKFDPKTVSKIGFSKTGPGMAFASATWHFSTDELVQTDSGDFFTLSRRYFKRARKGSEITLTPMNQGDKIEVGDQVEVQISLNAKHEAEYIHLRDPRAAGFEPESAVSGYKFDLGLFWFEEIRDSGTNFFFSKIPKGEYTFKYRLRASMAGKFRIGPAEIQSMYAPEFNAYTNSAEIIIR